MNLRYFLDEFREPGIPVRCLIRLTKPGEGSSIDHVVMINKDRSITPLIESMEEIERDIGSLSNDRLMSFTVDKILNENSQFIGVLLSEPSPSYCRGLDVVSMPTTTPLTLSQFICRWIAPNTLIRLWVEVPDSNGELGHVRQMLWSNHAVIWGDALNKPDRNKYLPACIFKKQRPVEVGMEWQVYNTRANNFDNFVSVYADFYVKCITDIVVEHDQEAINIEIMDTPNGGNSQILALHEILTSENDALSNEPKTSSESEFADDYGGN